MVTPDWFVASPDRSRGQFGVIFLQRGHANWENFDGPIQIAVFGCTGGYQGWMDATGRLHLIRSLIGSKPSDSQSDGSQPSDDKLSERESFIQLCQDEKETVGRT